MKVSTIKLDKEREIAYGTRALRIIEREIGRPITKLGTDVGITEIAALVYAGLAQLDRDITLDEVDDLLDAYLEGGGSAQELANAVTSTIQSSGWSANPTRGGK